MEIGAQTLHMPSLVRNRRRGRRSGTGPLSLARNQKKGRDPGRKKVIKEEGEAEGGEERRGGC